MYLPKFSIYCNSIPAGVCKLFSALIINASNISSIVKSSYPNSSKKSIICSFKNLISKSVLGNPTPVIAVILNSTSSNLSNKSCLSSKEIDKPTCRLFNTLNSIAVSFFKFGCNSCSKYSFPRCNRIDADFFCSIYFFIFVMFN